MDLNTLTPELRRAMAESLREHAAAPDDDEHYFIDALERRGYGCSCVPVPNTDDEWTEESVRSCPLTLIQEATAAVMPHEDDDAAWAVFEWDWSRIAREAAEKLEEGL